MEFTNFIRSMMGNTALKRGAAEFKNATRNLVYL